MPTSPVIVSPAIIAANSGANTAIAVRRAQEMRDQCNRLMAEFRHDRASVGDARAYAKCVQLIHPSPSKPGPIESVILGAGAGLVVGMLLAAIVMLFGMVLDVVTGGFGFGDIAMKVGAWIFLIAPAIGLIAGLLN